MILRAIFATALLLANSWAWAGDKKVAAVALYESVVGGTRDNRSLAGQLNGLNSVPL